MVGFSPRVPSKSSPREPTLAGDSELRARRKRSDPAERLSHGQSRRISPTAVRMIASAIELVSQLPVQWRRRGCAFVRQLRPAPSRGRGRHSSRSSWRLAGRASTLIRWRLAPPSWSQATQLLLPGCVTSAELESKLSVLPGVSNGASRDRTGDLLLAKKPQAVAQGNHGVAKALLMRSIWRSPRHRHHPA